MEIVTFIIAIAGFAMSLASWIHTVLTQRKNFDITIFEIKSYSTVTYLHLSLENRSRIPVAITRISLLLNGNNYDCTAVPKLVYAKEKKRGNEVVRRTESYSTPLPIQIGSLGATNCLVLFEDLPELPADSSTHLTLLVATNRGKAVQKTLELPMEWAVHRNFP